MKYLSQFLIILGFTLAGEALQRIIPLPIPASVYGLALLFTALCLKIVKVEQVKTTGSFGERMLSQERVKASLLAAFRMCGFGQAGTELVISSGAAPKERKKPLDELAETEF